jgi:endonuclease III
VDAIRQAQGRDSESEEAAHARARKAEEDRERVTTAAIQEVAETARKLGYARAKLDRLRRVLREIEVRFGAYDDLAELMRGVQDDLNDDPEPEGTAHKDKEQG